MLQSNPWQSEPEITTEEENVDKKRFIYESFN